MDATTQTLHTDVLVIGFGKGGKITAKTLGRHGRDVVLVEQSARMYGGTCPNVGCVPSKGLVHHSRKRRPEDDAQTFFAQSVEVDERLRTSQPHIFALGDVDGGPQFTYISLDDSRIVLDQLIGQGRRTTADRVAVPHTLFITPPLATVGLTEQAARAAGHRIKVAREAVADIATMPRAYAVEETRGLMKFVLDADTDLILGAALLCVDAQELINTVSLAMRHGITASELRDAVYTHPSSTEAFNEVPTVIVHEDPRG